MKNYIIILQTIISAVLIVFILIQTRGTGFGRSWGGASSFTRRGLERVVFRATFVLSILFLIISILSLVI